MILNREEASASIEWKCSQAFGERNPDEELQDVDIVSAIEFDKTGDYLAVGDRGGRVILFETVGGKNTPNQHISRSELEKQMDFTSASHPEYRYKTEFQSHEPEFDYLKSLEIEEKINRVRWCAAPNGSMFILSTNDKTIKLWKVRGQKVKKIKEMDHFPFVSAENTLLAEKNFMNEHNPPSFAHGYHLEWTENMVTKIANVGNSVHARCQKVYPHAHDFNINSISNNSDCETFASADDLRINLWNLEISDQCFNIVDMKPSNMDDLTEVITSAEFHPIYCNLLAYSSSRGYNRLVDMRQSALCDHSARILRDAAESHSCGIYVWILRQLQHSRFMSIYALSCVIYIITTLYLINLGALSAGMDSILQPDPIGRITVEAGKNENRKPILQAAPRARRSSLSDLTRRGLYRQAHENSSSGHHELSYNLSSKLLHLAWHPTTNLIACANGNSLFFHYA